MSFANTYKNARPPISNPCDTCKRASECDRICVARARWWDVAIKRILKAIGESYDAEKRN